MSKYVVFDLEMCKVPKHIKTENLHMEIIEIGAVLLDETYKEISCQTDIISLQRKNLKD